MSSRFEWKTSGGMIENILRKIEPEFKDTVEEAWSSLGIGKEKAEITTFNRGILVVKVSANAYMQELWFNKDNLIHKLNLRLEGRVKDIKFKLAGGY